LCRKSSVWALTDVDLDFVQVEADSVLEIECIDDDMIGDELLGKLHFPLMEKLRELPPDARLATWDGDFPLTEVLCLYLHAHIRSGCIFAISDLRVVVPWQWVPALLVVDAHASLVTS
jgi:hypothetical protein